MALFLGTDNQPRGAEVIAYLLKDNRIVEPVSFIDSDKADTLLSEDTKRLKKIRLNEADETFMPNVTDFRKEDQVDRIYVTGPTGTGKSTFIRAYTKLFLTKYPKASVYLFSSKKQDAVLDDLPLERMLIDEETLLTPYTIEELSSGSKPSLCIFDDIEDFPTQKLNKEIARFRDEVLRNGRSAGLFSIFVHHDPCNYKETKSQIYECNKVVIFPRRCGRGTYDYLCEKKLHMTKKDVALVNSLKSNYVCINKGAHKYFVSDKYIILDIA